jgi:hypothetical protein
MGAQNQRRCEALAGVAVLRTPHTAQPWRESGAVQGLHITHRTNGEGAAHIPQQHKGPHSTALPRAPEV